MTKSATAAAAAASSVATEKLARQRLSVLELAQTLGSVSTACRQRGVGRTQFYEYKRRFQEQGLVGLKDLPPIHKTHPQTTPPEVVERVLALSLEQPGWGCYKLSDYLKFQSIVSVARRFRPSWHATDWEPSTSGSCGWRNAHWKRAWS